MLSLAESTIFAKAGKSTEVRKMWVLLWLTIQPTLPGSSRGLLGTRVSANVYCGHTQLGLAASHTAMPLAQSSRGRQGEALDSKSIRYTIQSERNVAEISSTLGSWPKSQQFLHGRASYGTLELRSYMKRAPLDHEEKGSNFS